MTEQKYKVGDKAWIKKDDEPIEVNIVAISKTGCSMWIIGNDVSEWTYSTWLYPTKEALANYEIEQAKDIIYSCKDSIRIAKETLNHWTAVKEEKK